jgi:hypothetical protein
MSRPTERHPVQPARAEDTDGQPLSPAGDGQGETLPVLAAPARVLGARPGAAPVSNARPPVLSPVVQAAAAAAGGFLAGAALVGLVRRLQRRAAPARARRGAGGSRRLQSGARAGELVQIVGTRSLLLDVHLLGER